MKLTIGHIIIFLLLGGLANFHKSITLDRRYSKDSSECCNLINIIDSTCTTIEDTSHENSKKINKELEETNEFFEKTKDLLVQCRLHPNDSVCNRPINIPNP